jgi:hypothetical protein
MMLRQDEQCLPALKYLSGSDKRVLPLKRTRNIFLLYDGPPAFRDP